MTNAKPVKYLISGWNVFGNDYEPFKKLVEDRDTAKVYFKLMTYRNCDYMSIKVDNIECVWNAD